MNVRWSIYCFPKRPLHVAIVARTNTFTGRRHWSDFMSCSLLRSSLLDLSHGSHQGPVELRTTQEGAASSWALSTWSSASPFAKSSDPHFSRIFLLFLAHPAPDQPQHSLIFPFFHPVPQVPVPQVPVPQVAAAAPPWVSSTLLPIGAASVVRSFPASHPLDWEPPSPQSARCPLR